MKYNLLHSSLKNLISLRAKNLSKRIKQALEELAENIENNLASGNSRQPARIPVPVPANRNAFNQGQRRLLHMVAIGIKTTSIPLKCQKNTMFRGFHSFNFHSNFNNPNFRFNNKFSFFRKYSNYYSLHHKCKLNWLKFNGNLNPNFSIYNNFSTKYQLWYRLKLHNIYKAPSLNTILHSSSKKFSIANNDNSHKLMKSKLKSVPMETSPSNNTKIRLNISLSPTFYDYVSKLQNQNLELPEDDYHQINEIPKSSYLDISINPNILIPSSTFLNEDILSELINNVKMFEKKLIEIKEDLVKLGELGELPLKYIPHKNIIRIYFKNCDKVELQNLLSEKNIKNGTIVEEERTLAPHDSVPITEFDVLSSFNTVSSIDDFDNELLSTTSSSSSSSSFADSLPEALSASEIRRIETNSDFNNNNIQINNVDELIWA